MPYLFVYGTLRKGQIRHIELQNSQFIGYGTLEGYDMYSIGSFPTIVPGKGKVFGEVYSVDRKLLHKIDYIECVDYGVYVRRIVKVTLENNTKINAYVYIFNKPLKDAILIQHGDWIKFFENISFDAHQTKKLEKICCTKS